MQKNWLKNYPKGVPEEVNVDQYQSLLEMFDVAFNKFRALKAFRYMGQELTFAEVDRQSKQMATYFQKDLHLKKGDRLGLMMPNCFQYPIAMIAGLRAGLVIVNVNPLYTPRELIHQLNDADVTAIIVLENFASVLQKALKKTKVKHVLVTGLGDLLSQPKRFIVNFAVRYVKRIVPKWHMAKAKPLRHCFKRKPSEFEPVSIVNTDLAFLQYTGGTTGLAKGAMLTHRNMVANVLQTLAYVKPQLDEGKEITVIALPLYHIFSLTVCCLVFLYYGGMGLLIPNPRDLNSFIKDLKQVPFSLFAGLNTLFNGLLNKAEFCKLNFKPLKVTISGGMALQEEVAGRWHKVTNSLVIEGYGLTESSPVLCVNPMTIEKFTGSVGFPIPSTDIKIVDEKGKALAIGKVGEICARGPQVMLGYLNNPKETKAVVSKDGWLSTGDIGYIDKAGFCYIVDRKKDMIVVSGFNVYPTEVEDVISELPGVFEVAVVGVSAKTSGEMVKAFIVKRDPKLTERQVIDHCRKELTRYKIPKAIEFKEDLPKSNIGKVLRRALRDAPSKK